MSEFRRGDRIRRLNPTTNSFGKNAWDSHEFGIAAEDTHPLDSYVLFLPDEHLNLATRTCDCAVSAGKPAGGMLREQYVLHPTFEGVEFE